jgi:hypothetical protein
VNAKHPSDLAFGGVASFYGINDSFSKGLCCTNIEPLP